EEVKTLLKHAKDRLRLYLLLCLNCGMTQCDVSDLKQSEYDGKRITRKRSKTAQHENVPTVCYLLWPQTPKLLEKYSSKSGARLLLGPNGNPLKTERLNAKGENSRTDYIGEAFRKFKKSLKDRGVLDTPLALKHFRKTGANTIRSRKEYGKSYAGL